MPMDKQQALKEAELRNGNIARHDSLHPFGTADPYPDIRLLNHAYIVRTIANCQRNFTGAGFDQPRDKSLLLWGRTAAND